MCKKMTQLETQTFDLFNPYFVGQVIKQLIRILYLFNT